MTKYWLQLTLCLVSLAIVNGFILLSSAEAQVIIKEQIEVEKSTSSVAVNVVIQDDGFLYIDYLTGVHTALQIRVFDEPHPTPRTIHIYKNGELLSSQDVLDDSFWEFLSFALSSSCQFGDYSVYNYTYNGDRKPVGPVSQGDSITFKLDTYTFGEPDTGAVPLVAERSPATDSTFSLQLTYRDQFCHLDDFVVYDVNDIINLNLILDEYSLEIIPEKDTIYVAEATKIQVRDLNGGVTDPEQLMNLSLSDPSLGHFALVGIDEFGIEQTIDSSTVLTDIPYKDLDSLETNSDRYVAFVGRPIYQGAGKQETASIENTAVSDSSNTVQIYTVLSESPENILGAGKVFTVVPTIEVLNANRENADHVQIANWENAYDELENVRNASDTTDNFIDLDPERFFVRVTDKLKTGKDTLIIQLETQGVVYAGDDQTDITLFEYPEDSGIFTSKSLILTNPDFEIPAPIGGNPSPLRRSDDDFAVHDGITGLVEDDQKNDRTHKSEVGGTMMIHYTPDSENNSTLFSKQSIVCEDIKQVIYQLVTFREPYYDVGFITSSGDTLGANNNRFDCEAKWPDGCEDFHAVGGVSEPYLNISWHYDNERLLEYRDTTKKQVMEYLRGEEQPGTDEAGNALRSFANDNRGAMVSRDILDFLMDQTQIAWSPSCITFLPQGPDSLFSAPKDEKGVNIFQDRRLNYADDKDKDDLLFLFEAFKPSMSKNILYIFFGPTFRPKPNTIGGIAFTDYINEGDWISKYIGEGYSYTYISSQVTPTTIAHEFGHILPRLSGHAIEHLGVTKEEDGPQYLIFPSQHFEGPEKLVNHQVNTRRRFIKEHLEEALLHPHLIENQ